MARFWTLFGVDVSEEQWALKRAGGLKALAALERGLAGRGWLAGDSYTVADISLYAYTHVAAEGGFDLGRYPAIEAWLARVASRPGHITIDA